MCLANVYKGQEAPENLVLGNVQRIDIKDGQVFLTDLMDRQVVIEGELVSVDLVGNARPCAEMAEYEVVREVQNLCANNQMRDVFFDEIETDDPVEWIRREVKGKEVNLTVDRKADGSMTIYVESAGVSQKFLFTPV